MTAVHTSSQRERPILFSGTLVRAILEGRKTQTRRIVKWKPREAGLNLSFSGMEAGFYNEAAGARSGWVLRSRGGAYGCWNDRTHPIHCPFGKPGDRLWVRETHALGNPMSDGTPSCRVAYRADGRWGSMSRGAERYLVPHGWVAGTADRTHPNGSERLGNWVGLGMFQDRWRPSIHMPRWASRIGLEVTGVRVERLQSIAEDDAKAEGVESFTECFPSWPDQTLTTGERAADSPYRSGFAVLWDEINAGRGFSWASNPWVWVIEFRKVDAGAPRPAHGAATPAASWDARCDR